MPFSRWSTPAFGQPCSGASREKSLVPNQVSPGPGRQGERQGDQPGESRGEKRGDQPGERRGEKRGERRGDRQVDRRVDREIGRKFAAEARAKDLLKILELRGIPVSDKVRAQILRCTDPALLDQWLGRALVASSAAAVVSGKAPSKVASQPETRRPSGGRSPARSTRSTGGKRAETAKQPA